jgi:hypothetical protein
MASGEIIPSKSKKIGSAKASTFPTTAVEGLTTVFDDNVPGRSVIPDAAAVVATLMVRGLELTRVL